MSIRAHLDDQFARQFGGLPDIEKPIAPGLAVTEYRMDGVLLGNADIEMNNHEAIHGICAQGESDDQ
jgi:hypothetical protein